MDSYELYLQKFAFASVASFFIWHAFSGIFSGIKKLINWLPPFILILLTIFFPNLFVIVVGVLTFLLMGSWIINWIEKNSKLKTKEILSIGGLFGLCLLITINVIKYPEFDYLLISMPSLLLVYSLTIFFFRKIYLMSLKREAYNRPRLKSYNKEFARNYKKEVSEISEKDKISFFNKVYFDRQEFVNKQQSLAFNTGFFVFIFSLVFLYMEYINNQFEPITLLFVPAVLIIGYIVGRLSTPLFISQHEYKLWPKSLYEEYSEFISNRVRKFDLSMSIREAIDHFFNPSMEQLEILSKKCEGLSGNCKISIKKYPDTYGNKKYEISEFYYDNVRVFIRLIIDNPYEISISPFEIIKDYEREYQIVDQDGFNSLVKLINSSY